MSASTPPPIAEQLSHTIAGSTLTMSEGGSYARAALDVSPHTWQATHQAARDEGLTFFDWLSAVDEGEVGIRIVSHLWSVSQRLGVLLRTLVLPPDLAVYSIVTIFPGAAWSERETFEMFGVDFVGHPRLRKLLLHDQFSGNPLRKDFVLASRVVVAWPGAKEPGEGAAGVPTRKRLLPPGVPPADEWGPGRPRRPDRPGRPGSSPTPREE